MLRVCCWNRGGAACQSDLVRSPVPAVTIWDSAHSNLTRSSSPCDDFPSRVQSLLNKLPWQTKASVQSWVSVTSVQGQQEMWPSAEQ